MLKMLKILLPSSSKIRYSPIQTYRMLLGLSFCSLALFFSQFSFGEQPSDPPRIVILGDSLTAGYGVPRNKAFPALIQQKLGSLQLPHQVINAGISGDTSSGGLRRLGWLLEKEPAILVIELGANDGLRGLPTEMIARNLTKIITRTKQRYPRVQILLAGMKMPSNLGAEYSEAFQAIYAKIAREQEIPYIPFLLEGVGGVPEYNQSASNYCASCLVAFGTDAQANALVMFLLWL